MSASATENPLCHVRLVAFDIDGVFTDGRIHISDDGIETKVFYTQDGFGVRQLLEAGVEVVVISGRSSKAVEQRMRELGVTHVVQNCADKVAAFRTIIAKLDIRPSECVYVGDDVPDLPLLQIVGYSVAVANAASQVRQSCDYTTRANGGSGAVREVCDLVLDSRTESK